VCTYATKRIYKIHISSCSLISSFLDMEIFLCYLFVCCSRWWWWLVGVVVVEQIGVSPVLIEREWVSCMQLGIS